jgi:hypothetical protein
VGPLTSRHFAAILSRFGFLPAWIANFAELDVGGRVYKFFQERHGWTATKGFAKKLTSSLAVGLPKAFKLTEWTEDLVENFICKCYQDIKQRSSGRSNPARDQQHVRAPVVHRVDGKLKFSLCNTTTPMEEDALVYRWPMNGKWWTMSELAVELQMPSTLPDYERILSYRPPNGLKQAAPSSVNTMFSFPDWWL